MSTIQGSVAISMSFHRTTFCFICSHLASGEKEGDELKRNSDVAEIMKNAQFPRICKNPLQPIPERILEHEYAFELYWIINSNTSTLSYWRSNLLSYRRIIWLGDLNYRVSLSYAETRELLVDNDWDALLERDQAWITTQLHIKIKIFYSWQHIW